MSIEPDNNMRQNSNMRSTKMHLKDVINEETTD